MIIGEIGNRGPLEILIWDIGNIVMIFGYIYWPTKGRHI